MKQITDRFVVFICFKKTTVLSLVTKDRLSFIGKENDVESGLGDFGVRKYEGIAGEILNIIIRF